MLKKLLKSIEIIALSFLMFSCGVSFKTSETVKLANSSYSSKDYETAYVKYRSTINEYNNSGKQVPGELLNNAGVSAFYVDKVDTAIVFLEGAKKQENIDAFGYYTLALSYRKVDNLSREITNFELCNQKFPNDTIVNSANEELFDAYVRSENWDQAKEMWSKLNLKKRGEVRFLTDYLQVMQATSSEKDVYDIANQILKISKNSIPAQAALADYYYSYADSLYVSEMKAYQQNQTMKQYNKLLAALKKVNSNFRSARDIYEKLYKINPDPLYAKRLGNIYTRFENKKKASYYYKKAGQ
ncbi:MAG: hypothetical protein H6537_07720 [Bacteroidales bacterium]|nr:hypothetical protein [Bacteroidales bacterium]HPD95331.1 hypothetical protein [Tenuifilaceae bacterium]